MKRALDRFISPAMFGFVFIFSSLSAQANPGIAAIASRDVEVDGLKLRYLAAGKGPALILLNGYTQTSRMWRPIIPVLAKRFPDATSLICCASNSPFAFSPPIESTGMISLLGEVKSAERVNRLRVRRLERIQTARTQVTVFGATAARSSRQISSSNVSTATSNRKTPEPAEVIQSAGGPYVHSTG
jgi:hypothetical protein